MNNEGYNADVVARAMLLAQYASQASKTFREAYLVWEKSGKDKYVSPAPSLEEALGGYSEVAHFETPYEKLVHAANDLNDARSQYDSLPKEVKDHPIIKPFTLELSKQVEKYKRLLESKDLVLSFF